MPRRRCLRCCPKHPAACARTVIRTPLNPHATRCCGVWRSFRCGRRRNCVRRWRAGAAGAAQQPSLAPLLARRLNTAHSPALIRTTLDAALQRRLEDLLLGWRARLPERTSAAILLVEHETMAVRAYLGSVDISDPRRFGHVDMISAQRSPGSTSSPSCMAWLWTPG